MKNRVFSAVLVASTLSSLSCAQLMGRLRRDLNDMPEVTPQVAAAGPTYGGTWTERGTLLNDDGSANEGNYYGDRNPYINHEERRPASLPIGSEGQPTESWVEGDGYRSPEVSAGPPMASRTPNVAPVQKHAYKNGSRATRSDFQDDDQKEGSLWASDGQTNYFFTKNKVRGPGDIVTLNLEDAIVKDMIQESKRSLSQSEMERELMTIQERINAQYLPLIQKAEAAIEAKKLEEKAKKDQDKQDDAVTTTAAVPQPTPTVPAAATPPAGDGTASGTDGRNLASEGGLLANENGAILPPGARTTKLVIGEKDYIVPKADPNAVELAPLLELKSGETAMTEITERYPNGNYKISGVRKVNYKNGPPRFLRVTGIVKAADISEDDKTTSGKLYEYRIESLR